MKRRQFIPLLGAGAVRRRRPAQFFSRRAIGRMQAAEATKNATKTEPIAV
jgi:hypothetical protein